MDNISTCRAAYLIPFIDVLHDIGAPVERELQRAKLPTGIEDFPDDIVSNSRAIEFCAWSERHEGLDDLGWLWAQRFSSSAFSKELRAALLPLPTVKARLDRFAILSKLEDSDVDVGAIQINGHSEIYCDAPSETKGLNGTHISEWTQIMVLTEVIRTIAGADWSPDEINFTSDFNVCDAAREAFPNTRFCKASAHTSIVVPSSIMAADTITSGEGSLPDLSSGEDCGNIHSIKRLLRPYLCVDTPKIDCFSEVLRMSPRTLQRKLAQLATSYSELIETTRFEMATEMLEDPDIQLIDVAMTLGYENQSNFGRSFRRIAGISPGKYRLQMLSQDRAV